MWTIFTVTTNYFVWVSKGVAKRHVAMPSILSKPKAIIAGVTRILPYTILVRLLYTLLKANIRRFKIPYSSRLAQLLTVLCVRRDHREYFVILFILEHFFKNYIYKVPANRDDKFVKGGLCMLSMGIFAVDMSEGAATTAKFFPWW